ncbi:DUF6188 family protein [Amycolatopsis alkalitolerans]|uniref:Uncharacterized protein n=1 Tax=Amycolatopsis alkalitolerans TaxID=2547244 RepID=A0A5C4M5E1_9PSEU|nr:DUF6188 family protein [Amycolatopsis alkalitolerans]TNC28025.1 hypothetical protein FG385_06205 [Amycolatopsis alkalitolerans]
MDLRLKGKTLLSETVEYSAVLHFSDGYMARIESPFGLDISGKHYELSPETDPQESFQPMKGLLQQTVTTADVDNSGVLSLVFSNGATIRVEPDNDYEAWTVAGPDGFLIVSMPGGELAVWEPKTDSP